MATTAGYPAIVVLSKTHDAPSTRSIQEHLRNFSVPQTSLNFVCWIVQAGLRLEQVLGNRNWISSEEEVFPFVTLSGPARRLNWLYVESVTGVFLAAVERPKFAVNP